MNAVGIAKVGIEGAGTLKSLMGRDGMISRRTLLLQSCVAPALLCASKVSPEIGFATGTYGMKTMATGDALRTLADIGYDGVELCCIAGWPTDPARISDSDRKDLRKLIGDTGLGVPALLESLPVAGTSEKRVANLERLKMAVALANETGGLESAGDRHHPGRHDGGLG